jgi:F0F1-type ATP synthase assembly protein I
MFFSAKTWFLIVLLLIVLGMGFRRHLSFRSVYEQFETNSTLPSGIDVESIIKETESQ